jgi:hypothetical protein
MVSRIVIRAALAGLALCCGFVSRARAEEASAEDAPRPGVHHAPRSVAVAHEPMNVAVTIQNPHLVKRAVLVYRVLLSLRPDARPGAWTEIEFLRASPGPYVAVVPATDVAAPGLEYALEVERVDGAREATFASREAPFRVSVSEDLMDVRERVALARVSGRRSVVSSFVEYVSFGRSAAPGASGGDVRDSYYRVEGAYTYRPLRVVDEFSVHVGAIRGNSPVPSSGTSGSDTAVGLNYASPSVRFRLSDAFRLDTELLASVTEVGFSMGAGGSLDVGDPYGSKWRVGFETVQTFGTRFFSQVDIQATPRLRLSPLIEVTDMPHADRFGVRLVGEALYEFPNGLGVAVRGGYQARDAASGGPSAGLRVLWGF